MIEKNDSHLTEGKKETMIKLTLNLGLILISLLVVACSSTLMDGSWSNPDYKGQIKNVYILGIAKNELNRRIFEDTFGRNLSSQGVKTVSSYQSLPRDQKGNKEVIRQAMTTNGCDSILLTKLTGQRTETITNPGYATGGYSSGYGGRGGYGGRYGGGWGNYYGRGYDVTYMPATTTDFAVLTIESVLYDLKTEEMIWSAQLETVVEGNIDAMVQDFAKVVIKDLKGKGLI
jgi:hypothetical protein